MAVSRTIEYLHIDRLKLDALNPRIGRDKRRAGLEQDALLEIMTKWNLEELVDSFSEAKGFWTQDALIVIDDPTEVGKLTVVEGNRRLAALKLMYGAVHNDEAPPRWLAERLVEYTPPDTDPIFTELPTLKADSRDDVAAYLGFRHVTGIQEWAPTEKAEFITKMVEEQGLGFKEIAKRIGSKSGNVRQNYLAFKLLLQIEETEGFDWSEVEERFSVLFLSVRSAGTREFLGIRLRDQPDELRTPVPREKTPELKPFVEWTFGTAEKDPLLKDSRDIDKLGEILGDLRAVEYLRRTDNPDFEIAYSLTKASADLILDPLRQASRFLRLALAELPGRDIDEEVKEAAWVVIEGGVHLARATGEPNLTRAKEALLAA